MLEIAQGLMQIQDQSMMNNRHGVTVAEDDNKALRPRLIYLPSEDITVWKGG
jgi:hypothetical protein